MPSGLDWLWRPVLAGLMSEADLYDSDVTLARFAAANDALDVQAENDWRLAEALKDG